MSLASIPGFMHSTRPNVRGEIQNNCQSERRNVS
ncbi:hypothetical protein AAZX31_11G075300 [Glycine max]